jgi:hypothetical protein
MSGQLVTALIGNVSTRRAGRGRDTTASLWQPRGGGMFIEPSVLIQTLRSFRSEMFVFRPKMRFELFSLIPIYEHFVPLGLESPLLSCIDQKP